MPEETQQTAQIKQSLDRDTQWEVKKKQQKQLKAEGV